MGLLKFIFVVVFLIANNSFASTQIQEGVVEVSKNRAVYYKYSLAEPGKPTVVLLNGLIYPLANWDAYLSNLIEKGYGVILPAYSTQPESLRHTQNTPYFALLDFTLEGVNQVGLETKDLADDIMYVVDKLGVSQFHLQTLSYGSIVGSYIADHYANRISGVSLIAPAVMSSHRYTPYGQSRHNFYLWQKSIDINPFYNPDDYYGFELYQSMSMIMSSQKNSFDLKDISYNDFFSGVYQMARSSVYFDLKDEAEKTWPDTYLILASGEDANLQKDQLKYWALKKAAFPNSRYVLVEGAPHAIPGVNPDTLLEITDRILSNQMPPGEYVYKTKEVIPDASTSTGGSSTSSSSGDASNSGSSHATLGVSKSLLK